MAGQYHEPREQLSSKLLDIKRAIDSMMEELEAVDWYRQRAEASTDPELKAVLDHHQREEIEHFAMLLEWVRRHDEDFHQQLKTYLFSEGRILDVEEEETADSGVRPNTEEASVPQASPAPSPKRQTIGSLKETP